jgi:hypothetical protein
MYTSGVRWAMVVLLEIQIGEEQKPVGCGPAMASPVEAAQYRPRQLQARLLEEAENGALMSCERGAWTSREASGIHYHLGQARNDPMRKPPLISSVEAPWQAAGTAPSAMRAGGPGIVVAEPGTPGVLGALVALGGPDAPGVDVAQCGVPVVAARRVGRRRAAEVADLV